MFGREVSQARRSQSLDQSHLLAPGDGWDMKSDSSVPSFATVVSGFICDVGIAYLVLVNMMATK